MAKSLFPIDQPASANFDELIQVASGGTVSKAILHAHGVRQILFAMDAEQELTEHASPSLATVQVLRGELAVTVGGATHELAEHGWVLFPPNAPHAVKARTPCIWLLTMIQTKPAEGG